MHDKRLIEHLQKGGTLDDEVGSLLLDKMISLALKKEEIIKHINDNVLSTDDLKLIYKEMVYSLMPTPIIKVGAQLLVASQFFMEPDKLDMVVNALENYKKDDDQNSKENVLKDIAKEFAIMSKEAHDIQFGSLDFHIEDSGGLSMATYKSGERGKIGCLILLIIVLIIIVIFNI